MPAAAIAASSATAAASAARLEGAGGRSTVSMAPALSAAKGATRLRACGELRGRGCPTIKPLSTAARDILS